MALIVLFSRMLSPILPLKTCLETVIKTMMIITSFSRLMLTLHGLQQVSSLLFIRLISSIKLSFQANHSGWQLTLLVNNLSTTPQALALLSNISLNREVLVLRLNQFPSCLIPKIQGARSLLISLLLISSH